jgi:hypothetical protein
MFFLSGPLPRRMMAGNKKTGHQGRFTVLWNVGQPEALNPLHRARRLRSGASGNENVPNRAASGQIPFAILALFSYLF